MAPAVQVSCSREGYVEVWVVGQVVDDAQVFDDWYWCGVMWGGAVLQIRDRLRKRRWSVFVEDVSSRVLGVCISRLDVFRVAVSCRCKRVVAHGRSDLKPAARR